MSTKIEEDFTFFICRSRMLRGYVPKSEDGQKVDENN